MGGAIARGLSQGNIFQANEITVADLDIKKLNELNAFNSQINTTDNNNNAIQDADIIIIAVKPWLVDVVLDNLHLNEEKQILVSIAAGITFEQLTQQIGTNITMFRVVPNTAITELNSMTLIASLNASVDQEKMLLDIFNEVGMAMLIPESQIAATTALTSCGIAYVFKYIHAAMEAGVEMGIYPKDAMKMIAQSVKGAAEIILNNDTHPALEIDKVTTPGGYTIRGINELDHAGFNSAVIRAMKASK